MVAGAVMGAGMILLVAALVVVAAQKHSEEIAPVIILPSRAEEARALDPPSKHNL
jgi:hypothetical protein